MSIRVRLSAVVALLPSAALLLVALPAMAQPASLMPDKPSAATLRAEVETLAWLGSIGLSPAEAKSWITALDGVPALLANIESQENAPEVIAALTALRTKALAGEPVTDEDWATV
ncbi:MAG: hypothetical protein HZB16_07990, partial [Armatimonadetes bacterium]|nr:hypothetical protein [Armatimonadota bacterium]